MNYQLTTYIRFYESPHDKSLDGHHKQDQVYLWAHWKSI